jgi:hypothetical protein
MRNGMGGKKPPETPYPPFRYRLLAHKKRSCNAGRVVKQTSSKRVVGTGQPGPGRKRGVPNRVTTSARAIVVDLLQANAAEAQRQLDKLRRTPRLWVTAYTRLAALVVPRVHRDDGNTPLVNINFGSRPVTSADEAAAIYAEVIGRPDIDLSGLRFATLEHQGDTAPGDT